MVGRGGAGREEYKIDGSYLLAVPCNGEGSEAVPRLGVDGGARGPSSLCQMFWALTDGRSIGRHLLQLAHASVMYH
jgi:hypothetical protein